MFLSCVSQDSALSSLFFNLSSETFNDLSHYFNYSFYMDDCAVHVGQPLNFWIGHAMIPPRCSWSLAFPGQLSYNWFIPSMETSESFTRFSVFWLTDDKEKCADILYSVFVFNAVGKLHSSLCAYITFAKTQ